MIRHLYNLQSETPLSSVLLWQHTYRSYSNITDLFSVCVLHPWDYFYHCQFVLNPFHLFHPVLQCPPIGNHQFVFCIYWVSFCFRALLLSALQGRTILCLCEISLFVWELLPNLYQVLPGDHMLQNFKNH